VSAKFRKHRILCPAQLVTDHISDLSAFPEGSLTLHNWSRLATPHLGGVLEERVGVAIKVGHVC
jgi:hypothetical protein